METSPKESEETRRPSLAEPITDGQSPSEEILALVVDTLTLAQDCDSLVEVHRLVRFSVAALKAIPAGEFDDVGAWQPIGAVAQRLVKRLSHG